MKQLTFITGNLGKVEEATRYLEMPIDHISLDLHEIQSLDSKEIVEDKARRAFEEVRKPVLVEDVSFVFSGLGNLPGPLIKWFEKELGNEGLCRLVDGKDRSCIASVTYGFHDGKTIHIVDGAMAGTIAEHPKGDNSFGWAPVFIPDGMDRTYAELSKEEQKPIAMRNKAFEKLRVLLKESLA
jgi:inosine triphosphate pyrophosphatase